MPVRRPIIFMYISHRIGSRENNAADGMSKKHQYKFCGGVDPRGAFTAFKTLAPFKWPADERALLLFSVSAAVFPLFICSAGSAIGRDASLLGRIPGLIYVFITVVRQQYF
jgi:hypothetical protein